MQNIASSCETSVCNDRPAEILSENLPDDRSWAGTLSFVPLLLSQQVVELEFFKHSYIAGEDGLIACLLLDIMFWIIHCYCEINMQVNIWHLHVAFLGKLFGEANGL